MPIGQWKHSLQARATLVGRGSRGGGHLTLISLLRTCLSLKRPPSFRAFKQLECMDKSRVSFWWTWMFLLLIRNQEESHLKRTMGKSWVSWRYLLYLSQFKVCGLQESDGAVFINPARYIYIHIFITSGYFFLIVLPIPLTSPLKVKWCQRLLIFFLFGLKFMLLV